MKHVLFDLKQCLICSSLNDEEYVKETLIEASKIAKLEVLKVDTHKFEPHPKILPQKICLDKLSYSDDDHKVHHLFVKSIWNQFFQLN